MFRRKINKFRRQFAYEGQEDKVKSLETIQSLTIKNLVPPFDIEFVIESVGGGGYVTWRGVNSLEVEKTARDAISNLMVKEGLFQVVFHEGTYINAQMDETGEVLIY